MICPFDPDHRKAAVPSRDHEEQREELKRAMGSK
jgi:hypothetical protein